VNQVNQQVLGDKVVGSWLKFLELQLYLVTQCWERLIHAYIIHVLIPPHLTGMRVSSGLLSGCRKSPLYVYMEKYHSFNLRWQMVLR